MLAKINSAALYGIDALRVEVEIDLASGLPNGPYDLVNAHYLHTIFDFPRSRILHDLAGRHPRPPGPEVRRRQPRRRGLATLVAEGVRLLAFDRVIEHAVVQVLQRLGQPTGGIVVSGQGEFLARRVIQRLGLRMPLIGLSEILGPALSRCAPAHALAMIADQQTA